MAPATPPQYAQVYVHYAETRSYEHVGVNMNRDKLKALSFAARKALTSGGNVHPHLPHKGRHCVVFEARTIDPPSAKRICDWIENNDMVQPGPLTRKYAVSETFPDLVKLYFTAYRFYVDRYARGPNLHDDLVWYFKAAPLRVDEFTMVMEYCGFDAALCNAAMNDIMYRRVKALAGDPRERCPEEAEIIRWAQNAGIWRNMQAIEAHIRESFGRHDPARWGQWATHLQ